MQIQLVYYQYFINKNLLPKPMKKPIKFRKSTNQNDRNGTMPRCLKWGNLWDQRAF